MKYRLLFVIVIGFVTLNNTGCKKTPTEPTDNIQPGRRDYVWTVDTLKISVGSYMSILRLWGNSPTDIWATGDAETSKLSIWHYDGNKWSCDNTSRPMMPRGIWGSDNSNIWIGNINSSFWHFDGSRWSEYSKHTLLGYSELINQSMCGDSPNNIYATGFARKTIGDGYTAIIQHFDGNNWSFIDFPKINSNFVQIKKNDRNQYFINSWDEINASLPNKIFLFTENQLTKLYETDKFTSIIQVGNDVFFNIDMKLYIYDGSKLVFFKDLTDRFLRAAMLGRSSKDIFIWYTDGIKHYNGTDIVSVFPTNENIELVGRICFEKEVFFLAKDFSSNTTMCIKGKLKE